LKILSMASMLFFSTCGGFNLQEGYNGQPVAGTNLVCTTTQFVAAGFYEATGQITKQVIVSREPETRWRIELQGVHASVTRSSGAVKEIVTETFTIERTTRGFLLVSQRDRGVSPQIITIDERNSSFVYSSQHVNPFWNRASIYYGSCEASI
jgi:hypothetical protein